MALDPRHLERSDHPDRARQLRERAGIGSPDRRRSRHHRYQASDLPLIVFVAAFDEFALPAFDAAATDYLTKPLDAARFGLARDWLEQHLDPASFIRVHRSFIVRMDRVRAVRRTGRGRAALVMETGAEVPVSRRRRGALDGLA